MSRGNPEFDIDAGRYEEQLARGLSLSGESAAYFAQRRVSFLASCLREAPAASRSGRADGLRAMDFGCGAGDTVPLLIEHLGAQSVLGLDRSEAAIEGARARHAGSRATFGLTGDHVPAGDMDVVYTNGVFHHIPPEERRGAVDFIVRSLRPGGILSFWENNPWNPGTRLVMSRIPFDRNAQTLSASTSRRLLGEGGLEILRSDHLFLFPRFLRSLRPFELRLASLPLGAQYQVLCRRR